MVTQAVGWSEDMGWGQPSPGVPQTSHPGCLKCADHSVHCSLSGGGHPGTACPVWQNRNSGLPKGEEGKA